jgi:hypothetical protein
MNRTDFFFLGAGLGALTMYYFDPDRGRGRRSVCQDQWMARGRRAARYLDKAGRDLANRTRGLTHEARHFLRGETPSEDGHRATLDIMHENLSPGRRLILGALGGGLLAWGLVEDAPEACVLGTFGAALLIPAVTGHGVASVMDVGRPASSPQRTRETGRSGGTAGQLHREAAPIM